MERSREKGAVTMKRTLSIDIVGELWMPGCVASTRLDLTLGDGPFQEHFDNPTDPDEVWQYVDTHSGDFSRIIGIDAEYCEASTTIVDEQRSDDQVYTEARTISRTIHVVKFTPEQEDAYVSTLEYA
jgi:hypothetical protein